MQLSNKFDQNVPFQTVYYWRATRKEEYHFSRANVFIHFRFHRPVLHKCYQSCLLSWNSSANICPRDPDKSSPRLQFTKALRCQINPSKWRESIAGSFHVSIDDVDKLERLAKAATCDLSVAWHRFLTTKINIRRSWPPHFFYVLSNFLYKSTEVSIERIFSYYVILRYVRVLIMAKTM